MKKIIVAALIFVVSFGVSTQVFKQKGYPPGMNFPDLIQARNYALSGTYLSEDPHGVILSSETVSAGPVKSLLNPLSIIIYGQVFKTFGFKPDLPILISRIAFALFAVLIFFLVNRLAGFKVGLFAGLYAGLMPTMLVGALTAGSYEWAILFFGVGLLVFFSGPQPLRPSVTRLIITSALFSLAALARNALFISFIPFLLFDFWQFRSWKRSLAFLLPFIVIFGITLTPFSWLGVSNGYLAPIEKQPFEQLGHFFSDPYTYYYNQEEFVKKMFNEPGAIDRLAVHFASHWGYHVSLLDKFKAYVDSVKFYSGQMLDLISIGGPLIVAIILLGLRQLWRRDRNWFYLFILWFVVWLGALIFEQTGNWDHLIELSFPLAYSFGLGAMSIFDALDIRALKKTAFAVFVLLIAGHLVLASKWRFHDDYRSSHIDQVVALRDVVNQIPKTSVVAVGVHPTVSDGVAYYADRNIIYFNPDTMKELADSNKIAQAFSAYHVSAAAGFDASINAAITNQIHVPILQPAE